MIFNKSSFNGLLAIVLMLGSCLPSILAGFGPAFYITPEDNEIVKTNSLAAFQQMNNKLKNNDYSLLFDGTFYHLSKNGQYSVDMYKVNGNYAGNWTLKINGETTRQRFITKGNERYVINTTDPTEPCHKEIIQPVYEELQTGLLTSIANGNVFYNAYSGNGEIWGINDQQTGYSTRFIIENRRTLLFDLNSIDINNARVYLRLCRIQFDFLAPINEDLFELPPTCVDAPTKEGSFFDIVFKSQN